MALVSTFSSFIALVSSLGSLFALVSSLGSLIPHSRLRLEDVW